MRLLRVLVLSTCLSGYSPKFSDPQIEIAEEKVAYQQWQLTVFGPRDASVEQFKQWSKELRKYENNSRPLKIYFYPRDTHGKDFKDLLAMYDQSTNRLWVRFQTNVPGIRVD